MSVGKLSCQIRWFRASPCTLQICVAVPNVNLQSHLLPVWLTGYILSISLYRIPNSGTGFPGRTRSICGNPVDSPTHRRLLLIRLQRIAHTHAGNSHLPPLWYANVYNVGNCSRNKTLMILPGRSSLSSVPGGMGRLEVPVLDGSSNSICCCLTHGSSLP